MFGRLNAGEGAWTIMAQQEQVLRSLLGLEHAANFALVWSLSFPTLLWDLCVSISFLHCCDTFSFRYLQFLQRKNKSFYFNLMAALTSKTHRSTEFLCPLQILQPLCLRKPLGWSRMSPADPSSAQESLGSPWPSPIS